MNTCDPNAVPAERSEHDADEPVRRARALAGDGRYTEALAVAVAQLSSRPGDRDLHYLVAACLRCSGRTVEALAALEALEVHHPAYSLLHQERGYCRLAQRDMQGAVAAFERAVALNPYLVASWATLERLYAMSGDARRRTFAAGRAAELARDPAWIVQAWRLFTDGDVAAAERAAIGEAGSAPPFAEALRLLARIARLKGDLAEAEGLLDRAMSLASPSGALRTDYAWVLVERQRFPAALALVESLLDESPEDPNLRLLLATVCAAIGDHARAIETYRSVSDGERAPEILVMTGHALQALGRRDAAVDAYRTAAATRVHFGDAWWSLANLKTYRFSSDEIECMQRAESDPRTGDVDRIHLCFALGKAHEDVADYATAWRHYERGNALKRAVSHYDADAADAYARALVETCTASFFAGRAGVGAGGADPIFIVGLPRSGSTLVEQILASHARVEGTRELADLSRLLADLVRGAGNRGGGQYPGLLTELDPGAFERLGQRYLSDTLAYRTNRDRFVDKMPNNFRHIELIHLALPNATVIDVRREPMACCVANLKQLFASGQEFTYDIRDMARYYRSYLDLMRHWDRALPGRVYRLYYEDLVEDLEGGVRRLLEACGLDFEPACLEFHRNARAVATPSSEQVRRPLYREGLTQWRHFEPWLAPLREALGDAARRWRD